MIAPYARRLNALLFGLSDDLAGELSSPLKSLCDVRFTNAHDEVAASDPHIIFCDPDTSVVRKLRAIRPESPIIVVSRHPEIAGWLDSIEAGATDYCAAPFESRQVAWLVDSSRRSIASRQ